MKANNVHPVVFPPHTTHWLQPADKAFFKSLKSHWTKEGIEAVTKVGGRTLGKKEFFSLFMRARTSACSVETAQAAFRGTGLFPLDRNAIPSAAFAPSLTSELNEIPSPSPDQTSASASDVVQPTATPSPDQQSVSAASALSECEKSFTIGQLNILLSKSLSLFLMFIGCFAAFIVGNNHCRCVVV